MKELLLVFFLGLLLPFYSQKDSIVITNDNILLFTEFYDLLDQNYLDTINHDAFMNHILKQTASALDPYNRYFTKQETVDRNKSWSGISYAGIGASVNYINQEVVIEHCKKGYGADSVGLLIGDVIVEINDSNVTELTLANTIKLLKGPEGSSLLVKVKRGETFRAFTILRKTIMVPSIGYSNLQEKEIGIIKINQFLRGSGLKFRLNVKELINKGAKKIIIDLRGNRGGILKECVSMLSVFFPKNTLICELKSKDLKSNYKKYTEKEPLDVKIPIVLLVDKNTMSAAEIFAGAMQDLDRAVLIGDPTFGKGLVQGTRVLEDQSTLYVTAARYHLPSGRSIHKKHGKSPLINSSEKNFQKTFFTLNGRLVKAYNGISPDLVIKPLEDNYKIVNSISKSRLDFNFAVSIFRNPNFNLDEPLEISKKDYLHFLLENIESIKLKQELEWIRTIEETPFSKRVIKRTKNEFNKRKRELIKIAIDDIYIKLKNLIIYNSSYADGLYKSKIETDPYFDKAIHVISDSSSYNKLINFQ